MPGGKHENSEGEKISSIKHDYKKVKVTEAFKKDIVESFKKDDKLEHFIFDIKGKLLNTVYVSRKNRGISERLYPGTISNGILYQLIENENLDGWLLQIDKVE